jgi:hypothetical protein
MVISDFFLWQKFAILLKETIPTIIGKEESPGKFSKKLSHFEEEEL